jgi:hypothetical protein
MRRYCLISLLLGLLIALGSSPSFSQQPQSGNAAQMPPILQQMMNQGQVSPETMKEIQDCTRLLQKPQLTPDEMKQRGVCIDLLQKAGVTPEEISQLQEKGGLGTLTPEEIEAGKKLLEQKLKEPSPGKKPAEKTPSEQAKREET